MNSLSYIPARNTPGKSSYGFLNTTAKPGSDVYPYGSLKPERYYNPDDYDFGYQGKLMDDEIKGTGNSLDFGLRHYDSRLGRWFAPDPYDQFMSTYQGMGNVPTMAIDGDGGYVFLVNDNSSLLRSVMNALYSTEEGRKFLSKYIDNPNEHVFIGNTNNILRGEDGELADGTTIYRRHEGEGDVMHFSPRHIRMHGTGFKQFNFTMTEKLTGNVSVILLHKTGLNADKVTTAGHELGFHVYFADFKGITDGDEQHEAGGDRFSPKDSPARRMYKHKNLTEENIDDLPDYLQSIRVDFKKAPGAADVDMMYYNNFDIDGLKNALDQVGGPSKSSGGGTNNSGNKGTTPKRGSHKTVRFL